MKSHASAISALMLAGCTMQDLPPAPAQPAGGGVATDDPAASAPPETRYDAVGWAGAADGASTATGVFVTHPTLAEGSFVELTLLETGRTMVAKVGRQAPVAAGYLLTLSPVAAQALGVREGAVPVRVRQTTPALHERAAAEGGSLTRMDAPQVLLAALRKRLPPAPSGAASSAIAPAAGRPPAQEPGPAPIDTIALPPSTVAPLFTPPAAPPPVQAPERPDAVAPVKGGWVVQVAALSNARRAEALARELGGFTVATGALVRVRTGPYPSSAAAERGRAQAAARGYGDAKILRND